jgi:hypothetical protein
MIQGKGRFLIASLGVSAALALSGVAQAATVTYRNDTTQFSPVTFGSPGESTITVPADRTPVLKLEVPGVSLDANGDGLDADLTVTGPLGTAPPFDLVSDACTQYSRNALINFTDSAANVIGDPNCAGDLRPEDPRTLALFNGGPSSGKWTATITDDGPGPSPISFLGWGIRITHAPFELGVSGRKQHLRSKIRLSASCNAKCTIISAGDVKARTLLQGQGVNNTFKLPLKGRAIKRLDDGGKAKIKLTADDGYGDVVTRKLKVKILG